MIQSHANPSLDRRPATAVSGLRGLALLLIVAMSLSSGSTGESLAALGPSGGYGGSTLSQRLAEPARRPERASVTRRQLDQPAAADARRAARQQSIVDDSRPATGLAWIARGHLASVWLLSTPPPSRA